MPYTRDNSLSPQRRLYSVSPPPNAPNGAGPSKKAKTTVNDIQRRQCSRQLEKLLQNPNKEVALPEAWKEKKLEAPPDMVKNISGSVSGAGSGEFHVYKASRRREFERIKQMEQKAKAVEEQAAFQERQAAREAEAEAKTSKNRNKRLKRKAGRKGGVGAGGSSGAGAIGGEGSGGGGLKRKLENGAVASIGRPTEAEPESASEDDGEASPEEASAPAAAVPIEPPKVVETKTVVHDDD